MHTDVKELVTRRQCPPASMSHALWGERVEWLQHGSMMIDLVAMQIVQVVSLNRPHPRDYEREADQKKVRMWAHEVSGLNVVFSRSSSSFLFPVYVVMSFPFMTDQNDKFESSGE